MKKSLLVVLLIMSFCVLTGCNKESKLVCTNSQTQMGIKMDIKVTTYFDSKDIATKADMNMTVDAKTDEMAKTLAKQMKSSYDNVKQNGSKVVLNKTAKPGKNDKDKKKDVKKSFEKQGYKCK